MKFILKTKKLFHEVGPRGKFPLELDAKGGLEENFLLSNPNQTCFIEKKILEIKFICSGDGALGLDNFSPFF